MTDLRALVESHHKAGIAYIDCVEVAQLVTFLDALAGAEKEKGEAVRDMMTQTIRRDQAEARLSRLRELGRQVVEAAQGMAMPLTPALYAALDALKAELGATPQPSAEPGTPGREPTCDHCGLAQSECVTPSAGERKTHLDVGNVKWRTSPVTGTAWTECWHCNSIIQINAADLREGLRIASVPTPSAGEEPNPSAWPYRPPVR